MSLMSLSTEPVCRYCLPKGAKSKAYRLCERHTTLFKFLDYELFGSELSRRLAKNYRDDHSLVLSMTGPQPKAKNGEVVGVIESYELVDRRHHWVVRDINENLWRGESMRKDLVRFFPGGVDTEES